MLRRSQKDVLYLSALKGAAITRDRRSRLGKDNLVLSAVRAAIDAVLRYSGKT